MIRLSVAVSVTFASKIRKKQLQSDRLHSGLPISYFYCNPTELTGCFSRRTSKSQKAHLAQNG